MPRLRPGSLFRSALSRAMSLRSCDLLIGPHLRGSASMNSFRRSRRRVREVDRLRRDPDTILLARLVRPCRGVCGSSNRGETNREVLAGGLAVLVSVGLLVGVAPASADTAA